MNKETDPFVGEAYDRLSLVDWILPHRGEHCVFPCVVPEMSDDEALRIFRTTAFLQVSVK